MYLKLLSFWACLVLCLPSLASAHRQGESYIYLNVSEDELSGRFEIVLDDLSSAIPLDDNEDSVVSQEELEAHLDEVRTRLQSSLVFFIDGIAHPIEVTTHDFFEAGFGTFVQLEFSTNLSQTLPNVIEVERKPYSRDGQTEQPVLLIIESNEKTGLEMNEARHAFIFASGVDRRDIDLRAAPSGEMFKSFLVYGTHHILIGLDHLLFLLALLFPAVLIVRNRQWEPIQGFKPAIWNVLGIVTLFTIAHSITLSLSALDLIRLPERFVESLIAASIGAAAVANLRAVPRRRIRLVIFGFGLLHGMGFANVLTPYGVEPSNILVTLLAFNIGIELGQVAFVAAIIPVLYLLRRMKLYVPVVLWGGSSLLLLIALYWFVERAFDINMSITSVLQ